MKNNNSFERSFPISSGMTSGEQMQEEQYELVENNELFQNHGDLRGRKARYRDGSSIGIHNS